MRASSALVIAAGTVIMVLLTLTVLLASTGHAPGPALFALGRGAFGSWYTLTSTTLVRATPLVLTGIAVAIAFRAGVMNIGAEGQFLAGATVATALSMSFPHGGPAIGLVGGLVGGALWTAIPALLRFRFGVLEVISTLMLNAVAIQLVGWVVRGPLQESTRIYPQSDVLPATLRLPLLWPGTRLHTGFVMAVVLALGTWWFVARTAAGFRLRAVGMNAHAAASAGRIDVARTSLIAFAISGMLAGLAGAVEVQGVTYALYENLSPGYGYTAIAVALLARLDTRAVLATALLFAALQAGGSAMQRDAGVPAVSVKVVEAVLILAVVSIAAWQRRRAEDARR